MSCCRAGGRCSDSKPDARDLERRTSLELGQLLEESIGLRGPERHVHEEANRLALHPLLELLRGVEAGERLAMDVILDALNQWQQLRLRQCSATGVHHQAFLLRAPTLKYPVPVLQCPTRRLGLFQALLPQILNRKLELLNEAPEDGLPNRRLAARAVRFHHLLSPDLRSLNHHSNG